MDNAYAPRYSFGSNAGGIPVGEYAVTFARDLGLTVDDAASAGISEKPYVVKLSPRQWYWYQTGATDENGVSYAKLFDSFIDDANAAGDAAFGVESAVELMSSGDPEISEYLMEGFNSGVYHRIMQRNQDAQIKLGVSLASANKWLGGKYDNNMNISRQRARGIYVAAGNSPFRENTNAWEPPAHEETKRKKATAYPSIADLETAGFCGEAAVPVRLIDDKGEGPVYYMALEELGFTDRAALAAAYDNDTGVLKNEVLLGNELTGQVKTVPLSVVPGLSLYSQGRESITILPETLEGMRAADVASAVRIGAEVLGKTGVGGTVPAFDLGTPRMMIAGNFSFNVDNGKADEKDRALLFGQNEAARANRKGTARLAKQWAERVAAEGGEEALCAALGVKSGSIDLSTLAAGSFFMAEMARKGDTNTGHHTRDKGTDSLFDDPEGAAKYGRFVESSAFVFPAVQLLATYLNLSMEKAAAPDQATSGEEESPDQAASDKEGAALAVRPGVRFTAQDSLNIASALQIIRIAHAEYAAASGRLASSDQEGAGGTPPSTAVFGDISNSVPGIWHNRDQKTREVVGDVFGSDASYYGTRLLDQVETIYANLGKLENQLRIHGYDPLIDERTVARTDIVIGSTSSSAPAAAPAAVTNGASSGGATGSGTNNPRPLFGAGSQ